MLYAFFLLLDAAALEKQCFTSSIFTKIWYGDDTDDFVFLYIAFCTTTILKIFWPLRPSTAAKTAVIVSHSISVKNSLDRECVPDCYVTVFLHG